jgi:hypothetical protein
VNRTSLLIIVIVILIAGVVVWIDHRHTAAPASEAAATKPAEEQGPKITRDANGNVAISMSDEAQGDMGIKVAKPAPSEIAPEVKGFGRVADPAPLAGLMSDLATAQAAYAASSNELARLQLLQGQGNASARAFQAAEATAVKDRLAVQTAKDHLVLAWGQALAELPDLPAFTQALTSRESVLIRVDLPASETLSSPPQGARVITLAGRSAEATLLGPAATVDPQLQGQGFIFLIKPNTAQFAPGEAVTAYLKIKGEPLKGVLVPREAVVRAEGAGWIYVLLPTSDGFTRVEVPLDHPLETGYFVSKGVTADNYVVTTGAQQLLSTELKAQGATAE